MKKEALFTTLKELLTDKIPVTEEDLAYAEDVLKKEKSLVLYLRGDMKVERTLTPARFTAGAILPYVPEVSKFVICAGVPRAVLVVFEDAGKQLLGWAKRNEEFDLVLDKKVMEFTNNIRRLSPVDLLVALEDFAKNIKLIDREAPFSKQIGKTLAVLRARHEEITVGGKHATSSLSGLVPDIVFKALPRFLARVEKVTGKKPDNVKYKVKA
jgi:hypothetical protein